MLFERNDIKFFSVDPYPDLPFSSQLKTTLLTLNVGGRGEGRRFHHD